jgi:hypothetical protein
MSREVREVMLVTVVGLFGQGLVAGVVVTGRPPCRHGRVRDSGKKKKREGGEGSWAGLALLGRERA